MPASKAQQAATARYEEKAYDKVLVRLPKGQKEIMQAYAEAHSESVNGFINRAISEAMESEKAAPEAAGGLIEASTILSCMSEEARTHLKAIGEDEPAFVRRAIAEQLKRDKASLRMGINPATK